MKKLLLCTIILVGVLCAPLHADVDKWNTTAWTSVDQLNTTGSANVNKVGGAYIVKPPTNYLDDANLQAYYNFENALTDSKNSNTLTSYTNGAGSAVGYSTTALIKNGTYSLKCDTATGMTDYVGGLYRADSNLSASLPGKSGGTTSAYTAVFWYRTGTVNSTIHTILTIGSPANGTGFEIDTAATSKKLALYHWLTSGYAVAMDSEALPDNTNHFIAATWSGSNIYLYRGDDDTEPSQVATATAGSFKMASSSSGLAVNGYMSGTTGMLVGAPGSVYYDELAVFNRALSLTEITEIWTHGIDGAR